MIFFKRLLLVIFFVYLLPAMAASALWAFKDQPKSWREANWSSSGVLPKPEDDPEAAIYVLSATTGGMKGAVARHSWIVIKRAGASSYDRYDKVGWGDPIRRNNYQPDAFWYSNAPSIVGAVKGEEAARLIDDVEKAIQSYPYSAPGAYRLYPGPNSNTFVAHILRSVPELGLVLPPDAVGRDFLPDGRMFQIDADGRDLHATIYGLLGFSAGMRSGIELHFLGLVAGVDFNAPGIKIPAFGTVAL